MVEGNAGGFGVKISANANYREVKRQFEAKNTVMVQIEQSCYSHYLQMDIFQPPCPPHL